jgi:hypothetical protein
MTTIPVIALLVAAAALGAYLLLLYVRGVRKPVLIGLHLLLGFGGLETLVVLLKGTPNSDGFPAGPYGNVAAGFLALAAFSGLLAPIIGRRSNGTANLMVITHVGMGLAGLALCLAWVSSL